MALLVSAIASVIWLIGGIICTNVAWQKMRQFKMKLSKKKESQIFQFLWH